MAPRILFVDDEPNILSGIQKALRPYRDVWEMHFCESGTAALDKLSALSFDVLVTDLEMPGMSGKALLEVVHDAHPSVIRVILTGRDDMEMDLRKVPIAHHFLVKPCRADIIRSVIERTLALRAFLHRAEMAQSFPNLGKLPKAPWIYASLTKALSSTQTTATEVTRILASDEHIAAHLLAFARVRVIGNRVPPKTLSDAVMSLGLKLVKHAALTYAVFRLSEQAGFDEPKAFETVHRHAFRTAEIAGKIAPGGPAEDLFLAAMLHDIGKWAIGTISPERYRETHRVAEEQGLGFNEAERGLSPVSHAELGAFLLEQWGLTYPVVEAVAYHHAPDRIIVDPAVQNGLSLPQVVYIANALENGTTIPETTVDAWGIAESLEDWRDLPGTVRR